MARSFFFASEVRELVSSVIRSKANAGTAIRHFNFLPDNVDLEVRMIHAPAEFMGEPRRRGEN
jgi:hypothetical protein